MTDWTSHVQPFGPNRAPILTGWANDDSGPVTVAVDPATGRVLTSTTGGSGGTQYTDGDTPPAHPIGNALEFDNSGTWTTVSASNPLPVTGGGSSTIGSIVYGQVAMTASAVQLPSNTITQAVVVEALSSNIHSVFLGDASVDNTTGLELAPGSAAVLPLSNTNILYAYGQGGDSISFLGG